MRSSPHLRLTRVGRAGGRGLETSPVPSPHIPKAPRGDHGEKGQLGMCICGGSKALKFPLLPFDTYSYDSDSYSLWKVWEVTEKSGTQSKTPINPPPPRRSCCQHFFFPSEIFNAENNMYFSSLATGNRCWWNVLSCVIWLFKSS